MADAEKKIDTADGFIVEIAGEILDAAPEPSEHAIEEASKPPSEKPATEEKPLLKDSAGHKFNPAVHETNTDGTPTVTKSGRYRRKRNTQSSSKLNIPTSSSLQTSASTGATSAASGKAAAGLVIALGRSLGGDEWLPRIDHKIGLDEQAMLEGAFANYFQATGKTDIPPGWALVVSVGAYALPRFHQPATRSRVKSFTQKIYLWWQRRKNGAQSNTGDDGIRKNDTGEASSGSV